ncbi:hypothetical protein CBS101457_006487 [Exobasidium rhododendri]|nr:hypothetical protein CBS101457_006487 [Exobasidium rhododendri]
MEVSGGKHQPTETSQETRLSTLLRETKTLKAKLRAERQENKGQSHPSLVLARKSLRNAYLKLLFNFPFSSRGRGVDSQLWIETSHPGVHVFRSVLSQLEKQIKTIQSGESHTQGRRQDGISNGEANKQLAQLMQKYARVAGPFRAYLAEEEMFWRELVGRMVRVFNIEEAKPSLQLLGIVCDRKAVHDLNNDASSTGFDRVIGADAEGGDLELQSKVPANAARLMEIIHKGLLCCGDLARYRELYKQDRKDEPHVKGNHAHRGGKRGGRGGGQVNRVNTLSLIDKENAGKDYTVARQCYEQARAILPSNGQASNALAVLAMYKGDLFASVYHYYRAICVVTPFEPAGPNLEGMLRRVVENWQTSGETLPTFQSWKELEKQKESLFSDLVILHGHFYISTEKPLPLEFTQTCHETISSLLTRKALAADTIVQIVVTAIASLWTRRLWRGKEDGGISSSINSEQQILLHLVGLFKLLAKVGTLETRDAMEASKTTSSTDLRESDPPINVANNITAAFRRMLPALRIASKWIKSQLEYLERSRGLLPKEQGSSQENAEAMLLFSEQRKLLASAIGQLWSEYVSFLNMIRFAFPFDQLPKLGTVGQSGMTSLNFEEDRDMKGFVPMKKAMLVDAKSDGAKESQLHPNEEQLIRIADLLIDAKVIAEFPSSPIAFDNVKNHFYLVEDVGVTVETEGNVAKAGVTLTEDQVVPAQNEDSKWENGSESTEDAVDLAMRAVDERRRALGTNSAQNADGSEEEEEDDDDDDGEIILIPSIASASLLEKHQRRTTMKPIHIPSANAMVERQSSREEPLTAQHLLLQVINGTKTPSKAGGVVGDSFPTASPSTPQPQLLFGGVTSSTSQISFASLAHHGGAWDGNEALHFMNQQQQQQHNSQQQSQPQQPLYPSAYPTFGSTTPWGPPSGDHGSADWR